MSKYECGEKGKIVGVATSDNLIVLILTGQSNVLPLRNSVLVTKGIEISPAGLSVQKDGNYLITFSVLTSIVPFSTPIGFSIFASSKFLGSTSAGFPNRLGNFTTIMELKKGDLVYVLITSEPFPVTTLSQATLTVVKID